MTKKEIMNEISYHSQKITELQKMLESAVDELKLDDYEKPFRRYTINELEDLYSINQKVFEWFNDDEEPERKNMSIIEYNQQALKKDRMPLADNIY